MHGAVQDPAGLATNAVADLPAKAAAEPPVPESKQLLGGKQLLALRFRAMVKCRSVATPAPRMACLAFSPAQRSPHAAPVARARAPFGGGRSMRASARSLSLSRARAKRARALF